MNDRLDAIVAIDIHTHATVSTRNAPDGVTIAFDAAMAAYFKETLPRPTIAETAAFLQTASDGCRDFSGGQ